MRTLGAFGELLLGGRAGSGHGAQDAPAGGQDLLVAVAGNTLSKFRGAPAGECQVGVAVDKTRQRHPATGIDPHRILGDSHRRRHAVGGPHVDQLLAARREGRIG